MSKHRRLDERENETYRLVVLFLTYTGVRFGEMAALRVSRLDLTRRRATIAESVTVVQGKGLVWGTPKTHGHRQVPIPKFLVVELGAHVAGRQPDDLVFTGVRGGGPLRAPIFRAGFDAAALAIGTAGLHPHELRHTAASLAIASGADVKVVQQMLGHSSAAMTMDVYGHLFHDRLDEVADALDKARAEASKAAEDAAAAGAGADSAVAKRGGRRPSGQEGNRKRAGQGQKEKSAPGRIRTFAPASRGRVSMSGVGCTSTRSRFLDSDPLLDEQRYVYVEAGLAVLVALMTGRREWADAIADGSVLAYGNPDLTRDLATWFLPAGAVPAPARRPAAGRLWRTTGRSSSPPPSAGQERAHPCSCREEAVSRFGTSGIYRRRSARRARCPRVPTVQWGHTIRLDTVW